MILLLSRYLAIERIFIWQRLKVYVRKSRRLNLYQYRLQEKSEISIKNLPVSCIYII